MTPEDKMQEALKSLILLSDKNRERDGSGLLSPLEALSVIASYLTTRADEGSADEEQKSLIDWSKIKISLDISTGEHDYGRRAFSDAEPHDIIDLGGGHIQVCMTGYVNEEAPAKSAPVPEKSLPSGNNMSEISKNMKNNPDGEESAPVAPAFDKDDLIDMVETAMDNIHDYDTNTGHFAEAAIQALIDNNIIKLKE